MLSTLWSGPYGQRIINTGISFIATLICVMILYALFRKHFESKRQRHQFRSRLTYIAILVFLLILIRIWIEGFTHIFTMLSLVAAGLVITNKESIMNIAGWLIINWRGVFSEGDWVQIQNTSGYLTSISLFHFKLYETVSITDPQPTGKTIKLPNSLIIGTPFTLIAGENPISLQQFTLPLDRKNTHAQIKKAKDNIDALLSKEGINLNKFVLALKKKNPVLSKLIQVEPKVEVQNKEGSDTDFMLIITYYCTIHEVAHVEQKLIQALKL